MPDWSVDPKVPLERECISCGRKIKSTERAFRVDGTPYWKCSPCQFRQDENLTEREMRKGHGLTQMQKDELAKARFEKARLKQRAAIYN